MHYYCTSALLSRSETVKHFMRRLAANQTHSKFMKLLPEATRRISAPDAIYRRLRRQRRIAPRAVLYGLQPLMTHSLSPSLPLLHFASLFQSDESSRNPKGKPEQNKRKNNLLIIRFGCDVEYLKKYYNTMVLYARTVWNGQTGGKQRGGNSRGVRDSPPPPTPVVTASDRGSDINQYITFRVSRKSF